MKANRQRGVQISPCIPPFESEQNTKDKLKKNLSIPRKYVVLRGFQKLVLLWDTKENSELLL
jgi:hypothetical protein